MIILLLGFLLLLVSILLIILILLQNPKDQGGQETLGGMQQMIGVAHVANFLEKITYGLCILFFALALSLTFFLKQKGDAKMKAEASANLAEANAYATEEENPSTEQ